MPEVLFEVNSRLPPSQNAPCTAGKIAGNAGIGFTVTTVAADGALGQPAVTTTV